MILLVALVCAAPFVSAWVAYYFIKPSGGKSYGNLLETKVLAPLAVPAADSEKWAGKWRLVALLPADCAQDCRDSLYATRQARTMLGREKDRVVRVMLTSGPLDKELLAQHPDAVAVTRPAALPPDWQAALAGGWVLIDPLGNQVITWPQKPDIKKLNQDLSRLMRASRIG